MIIKVEAMIREEKLEDVLDAWRRWMCGITCYQVMGCGAAWFQNTPTFVDTSR
ncbi:MAG: hypothetical protein ACLVK8_02985 [Ruminococcus sp.]